MRRSTPIVRAPWFSRRIASCSGRKGSIPSGTSFVEGVNMLDALVMSSNAFTSNGYAVLGNSIPGKLDSLILVWGGYLISGVSVATLTSAILMKYFDSKFEDFDRRFKEMEDLLKEYKAKGTDKK